MHSSCGLPVFCNESCPQKTAEGKHSDEGCTWQTVPSVVLPVHTAMFSAMNMRIRRDHLVSAMSMCLQATGKAAASSVPPRRPYIVLQHNMLGPAASTAAQEDGARRPYVALTGQTLLGYHAAGLRHRS